VAFYSIGDHMMAAYQAEHPGDAEKKMSLDDYISAYGYAAP
jgi:hypothetical protein